jgi:mannose-1-phosphate guanylyltransferase
VHVYAAEFGWSDLGTWGALYDINPKDENQNSIVGKRVKTYDTHGCIVNMNQYKVAVLQGVEDLIIVDTEDVLLICKRSEEQQIRQYATDVKLDFGEKYS